MVKIHNYAGIIILCLMVGLYSNAQNIVITDEDSYTADPSAMLDVKSLDKGLLVPRMTSAQRIAISNPADGLIVFDLNENEFYFYRNTSWIPLSSGQLWSLNGSNVYLTDINNSVGVGTMNPAGKLEVKGDPSIGINEPLFAVVNNNGDTVFAVYSEGVRVWVNDDGGAKASGSRGGFAVGGFNPAKAGFTNEYLRVTPDSVRIYIEEGSGTKASGSRGGFAVGGFNPAKTPTDYYFNIEYDSTEIINPSEARMLWYPNKEAFLSGRVLVESVDSVGTNSMAMGYESKSIGDWSQALGYKARAFNDYSTAIGKYAEAKGLSSFAFGDSCIASGLYSFALGSRGRNQSGVLTGSNSIASGDYSYAFGNGSRSTADGAFAMGTENVSSGSFSVTIGYENTAENLFGVAIGNGNLTSGNVTAVAIGRDNISNGPFSVGIGNETYSYGWYSVALGDECRAGGYATTAAGDSSVATGMWATAIGRENIANDESSTAIGTYNLASGLGSLALGYNTIASGDYSTTMGYNCNATGVSSTAMGRKMTVSGSYSFGICLSNPAFGYFISQSNTMAIMGGSVGIGTGTPAYPLCVRGTANINDGITSGIALRVNGDEALWYNGTYFSWGYGGTYNYFADRVGIGDTDPSYKLELPNNSTYYYGSARAYSWVTYSDSRVKKNQKKINYGLKELMALVPKSYDHHVSSFSDGRLLLEKENSSTIGLIAQEVYTVIPEAVLKPENENSDLWSLDYEKLIPVLISAIQEQQKIIEEQEDKIKEFQKLESRMSKLEATINVQTKK